MENKEKKVWYKKKRYIIPTAILGLIVVLGLNNTSDNQQIKANSSVAPLYQNNVQVNDPTQLNNLESVPVKPAPVVDDSLSNDNHYVNVNGDTVHSPAYSNSVPVGASARCRDGTYSFSQNRRGTCSHHGGVAEWL